jgi:CRP/FNR family cyclic AMP-dependent transcriptional regulator
MNLHAASAADVPRTVQAEAQARFLEYCQRRQLPKNHVIMRPGDAADTLYYVVEGQATVLIQDEDGHELILTYLKAGDFIGEIGLFVDSGKRGVLIRARTPVELAQIGYRRLHHLLANELSNYQAPLLFALARQLSERLLHTRRQASQLAFMDITQRISHALVDLCRQPEAMSHPHGTQVHISRQELSRIVGCSREMAGRALKSLEDDDLIEVAGMNVVVRHTR